VDSAIVPLVQSSLVMYPIYAHGSEASETPVTQHICCFGFDDESLGVILLSGDAQFLTPRPTSTS
jgi:hypothetical protein